MSTIETNTVKPISGSSTLTLGESGDTVSLGTGVTAGTGLTGTTINNNADNRVITGSGTANTLEGEAGLTFEASSTQGSLQLRDSSGTYLLQVEGNETNPSIIYTRVNQSLALGVNNAEKMRIKSDGDIGIGTTSPDNSSYFGKVIHLAGSSNCGIMFNRTDSTAAKWSIGCNSAANLDFVKESTLRMRIDTNGDIIQGTTSAGSDGRQLRWGSSIHSYRAGTADAYHMVFFNANGEIGRIRTSGSSTAYNTSSDYRLKENEVAISDGIARLKQLKPYRFNFKADADTTVDGFFAHEVSSVVPEAIDGIKDAMHPEVLYTADDELPEGKEIGDVKEATKINPQAIDQSKLVPLLTSALQEAITKIETLEAKVAALESA